MSKEKDFSLAGLKLHSREEAWLWHLNFLASSLSSIGLFSIWSKFSEVALLHPLNGKPCVSTQAVPPLPDLLLPIITPGSFLLAFY